MIITNHCYKQAKERMGLTPEEVREDINSGMRRGIRRNKIGYIMYGKKMVYAGDVSKSENALVLKTAMYHLYYNVNKKKGN